MQRTLASLLFCAAFTAASAQIDVTETDAMRNNALKRTEQLNKQVSLSAEQRDKVYATYMKVEQYQVALDQRFAHANLTPEQREVELKPQRAVMAKMELDGLTEALTPKQLEMMSAPEKK
jgi:hypothetical protein